MKTSIEKAILRIKLFSLTCTLNDNGTTRHFHNGHEYVEIGGIKWATMNIGANSITDYGLYFQWGDTQGYTASQVGSGSGQKYFGWADYKYITNNYLTKYNNADKKTVLEPLDDAVTFNMGIGWRMPTREEFKVLFDSSTNEWVTDYQGSGVNGRLFTDKTDNTKTLFFPSAGYCGNGSVYNVGNECLYWSSSLNTDYLEFAFDLFFNDEGAYWNIDSSRYVGFAVRAVVG